jgi:hypothetical protein
VEADQVYVIPPGRDLSIEDGKLCLVPHARIAEIVHRELGVDFTHYKSNVRKAGGATAGVSFRPRAGEAANG